MGVYVRIRVPLKKNIPLGFETIKPKKYPFSQIISMLKNRLHFRPFSGPFNYFPYDVLWVLEKGKKNKLRCTYFPNGMTIDCIGADLDFRPLKKSHFHYLDIEFPLDDSYFGKRFSRRDTIVLGQMIITLKNAVDMLNIGLGYILGWYTYREIQFISIDNAQFIGSHRDMASALINILNKSSPPYWRNEL